MVVLTKADQTEYSEDALAVLEELEMQGIALHAINGPDADSVAVLQPWLGPGRTVVLVGSSGAGKSTLTNTLLGEQRMRTNAVRANDSRGRHTTTHRALMPLPTGACLIDTPGMRELKPTGEETLSKAASPISKRWPHSAASTTASTSRNRAVLFAQRSTRARLKRAGC